MPVHVLTSLGGKSMHEVSLAQGIVDVVTRNAKRAGIIKVNDVRVAVGKLAGVDIRATDGFL